jgi:choline dehydrogenase-like flavoprotein
VIIDLNDLPSQRFQCDICVVGTGAAGLTLASVLLKSRKAVLFLESGGLEIEPGTSDLNRCEISDLHFVGDRLGRSRVIGGSTRCWSGQLLPLAAQDFEERPWIKQSGWPFDLSELENYYKKALHFLGADNLNFDSDLLEVLDIPDQPFDKTSFRFYFAKWSPHPDLRSLFMSDFEESTNSTLLHYANLTKIHLSDDLKRVTQLEVKNQKLVSFRIECTRAILCLGGIETPRVLLANNHQIPEGIGNRYRLVGKYFQDHPTIRVGILHSKDPGRVVRLFGPNWHDGRLYTGKISLTSAKQREFATLNATAYCDGESYPRVLEKRMLLNLLREKVLKDRIPAATFNNLIQLLLRSLSLAVQRRIFRQDAQFAFTIMTEQEPFADSAISLGKTRDRYGVPRANIHWRLTENTWRTVMCFARLLEEEFESTRLGTMELLPYIKTPSSLWRIYPHDAFHHMGSTRMAVSPDRGVVDPDCKVFGIDNLYLISSAVFPTSGSSNPTLTIVALAYRLLEHLSLSSTA